jgi:hypothetical protein
MHHDQQDSPLHLPVRVQKRCVGRRQLRRVRAEVPRRQGVLWFRFLRRQTDRSPELRHLRLHLRSRAELFGRDLHAVSVRSLEDLLWSLQEPVRGPVDRSAKLWLLWQHVQRQPVVCGWKVRVRAMWRGLMAFGLLLEQVHRRQVLYQRHVHLRRTAAD